MELKDLFFHVTMIIPLEFIVLHSTPLGPILTEIAGHLWAELGFDWALAEHVHELAA
jgi:hypothetical protein